MGAGVGAHTPASGARGYGRSRLVLWGGEEVGAGGAIELWGVEVSWVKLTWYMPGRPRHIL